MPLCTLASSSDTERLGNLRNQKYQPVSAIIYCFCFFKQLVLIFVFFGRKRPLHILLIPCAEGAVTTLPTSS
jgi:hypothetical protein